MGVMLGEGGHLLADYLAGTEDIHAPVELDKNETGPGQGSGADAADIGGAVDGRFDGERDEAFHLFGSHDVGIGHHHHLRSGEVGEDIDVGAVGRPQPCYHEQDCRHKDKELVV